MIKFIKKNPAIPQRWIVLTALAYSLTAAQAQTPQAEKAFIKENMELNPEKPDVPLNKNDAFQKVQKRRVQEKR